jgi:hypothetical protein
MSNGFLLVGIDVLSAHTNGWGKMMFIELNVELERDPKLKTRPVTVNSDYIIRIEPRETIDKDGGASVSLTDGDSLKVVESYKSLNKRLRV